MKLMRIVAALSALIPFMFAGCGKQSQQTVPNSAHAVTQAAAPPPPSSAPTTVQKAAPVFVYSTTLSTPKTAPTTNANQGGVYEASSREDLPQADENVVLQGTARSALEMALSEMAGTGPMLLPDQSAAALMDDLPQGFRDSCDAMVDNDFGLNAKGTAKWTVRELLSLHRPEGTEAVLALRCSSVAQGHENDYDERPVIVSFTPETATLALIPLAPQQNGDPNFYRLSFSQTFTAVGAQLVELGVYHDDYFNQNGTDGESGDGLLVLDLATGKQVLQVNDRSEEDSYDDSTGVSTTFLCESKISYLHDAAGNVESIVAETRCTEDKERISLKKQTFRWNEQAHHFDEVK